MLTHFVSNRITFVFLSDWHERGDMIYGIRHVWNCFKHICKWVSRLTRNYTILSNCIVGIYSKLIEFGHTVVLDKIEQV